jgi:hypothetical protein
MSSQQFHVAGGEPGVFPIVVRFVGVIVLVLGFALIANWPELSGAAHAQTAPLPDAAPVAGSQSGTDPSVPDAAGVFAGRVVEPSPQIDTF